MAEADYSRIAQYYDRVRSNEKEYLEFWTAPFVKYGRITGKSRVLDIGCGTGRFSVTMKEMTGAHLYGLDISPHMLEKARQKDGGIEWVEGGAEDLPFEDETFDTVTISMAIHQFGDKKKAIREAARVLKRGGRLIVFTTSHGRIKRSWLSLFPGIKEIDLKRFPTIPAIKEWMRESGLEPSYHIVSREREMSVEDMIDKMRRKFISTLEMMDEDEYRKGLVLFEKRLRERYGRACRDRETFYYVVGEKH